MTITLSDCLTKEFVYKYIIINILLNFSTYFTKIFIDKLFISCYVIYNKFYTERGDTHMFYSRCIKPPCLLLLCACLTLLCGCRAQSASYTVLETTVQTTSAASEATLPLPTERHREIVPVTSFSDVSITMRDNSIQTISYQDILLGEIVPLDVREEALDSPFSSNELYRYLEANILSKLDPEPFDYMFSSSSKVYVEATFDNSKASYIFHIVRGSAGNYAIWLDRAYVDNTAEEIILDGILSTYITSDYPEEPTLAAYPYDSMEFFFHLPDDMEQVVTSDSSGCIYRNGQVVGGYTQVAFPEGILTDPMANEAEIVKMLAESVKDQIDLQGFQSSISPNTLISVNFTSSEDAYTHYIFHYSYADVCYNLWFHSSQLDPETESSIVHSAVLNLH